ncbi:hypothetical protein CCZ01_09480, partial [Helicobacter monodelphidis]
MYFLQHLKIGTKLILIVASAVLVGLTAMTIAVLYQSQSILEKEAEKLLYNAAKRQANYIMPAFDESFGILESTQSIVKNMPEEQITERFIDNITKSVLDTSNWASHAFAYIYDDPEFLQTIPNTTDTTIIQNGRTEFLLVLKDDDLERQGGISPLSPDPRFLQATAIQQAIQTQKAVLGEPMNIKIGNEEYFGVNIATPLFKKGKMIGVIGLSIDLQQLTEEVILDKANYVYGNDFIAVLSPNAVYAASPIQQILGKKATDVNPHPSIKIMAEAQTNRQDGFFELISMNNEKSFAGLANFEIWRETGIYWSVVVVAPEASVFAPISNVTSVMIASSTITFLLIMIVVMYYVRTKLVSRIHHISDTLLEFFGYLNHKVKVAPKPLKIIAEDELGKMGVAINENIQQTNINLDIDAKLVKESLEVVEFASKG